MGSAPSTGCSPTSSGEWSGRPEGSLSAPRTGTSPGFRRTCGSTSPSRTLGGGSSPAGRPRRPPRGRPAGAAPAGVPRRGVARAVRSAHVGVRRDPRGGRHDVGGGTCGPGVSGLGRRRGRRENRVAARPAHPGRGGRRAPARRPPAAAAQRRAAVEAGAVPPHQRPEARPRAQPARVGPRTPRRLSGLRRRRDRRRTAAGRGPDGSGLRRSARRGADPSRGPGGPGRRPRRAGPRQGPRGDPPSRRHDGADAVEARR